MSGHLFVLRGDLTQLQCSAILVPCDHNWELIWEHWSELLPPERFESSPWGARLRDGGGSGRIAEVAPSRDRLIRLVVTADGRDDAQWVARGVVDAIKTLAGELSTPGGRFKPLIALPLVGTGAGGFREMRGILIRALLPALRSAAHDADVDVALVLRDDRDHAAIQGQRSTEDWPAFSGEELAIADELGARAARRELSLFLGSGVSVPLGLPNWRQLLTEIAGKELTDYSPETAPAIAQRLMREKGPERFRRHIADRVSSKPGFAPAHLLLSALEVAQTVTTNYDAAYETALETTIGSDAFRVLTRQLPQQPRHWVLKVHGDVRRAETIVITEDDYARLKAETRSVLSIVETLLLTSHLLFVGFSMGDPDFVEAVEEVRKVRALAEDSADAEIATVLALHPGAVAPHAGFTTVPMLDGSDDRAAARRLEMFLDRICWATARQNERAHSYLLDPDYTDLFIGDPASLHLRDLLAALAKDDVARGSAGWPHVEKALTALGARPRRSLGY
nr:SIR2 family protein [Mycolicibacterium malmesburyense]CRL71793.1 hypothetical protein CPGR_02086 [Mycolicibacterium malmesburyense]